MRNPDDIVRHYTELCSEWLEMMPEGERGRHLCRLLAKMLIMREEQIDYLIKKEKANVARARYN